MQGTLWAVPFDAREMVVTGTPQSVQGAVAGREGSAFALGHTGPLMYFPTQGEPVGELVLLNPDGTSRVIDRGPLFAYPAFSNDAKSIAVGIFDEVEGQSALWIYDVASGAPRRIAEPGAYPLWSPDDQAITYTKRGVGIVRHRLDGANSDEVLFQNSESFIAANAWIDQGRTLVFHDGPRSDWDIYTLEPGGKSRLLIDHRLPTFASITRDERWVTFCTWTRGVMVGTFPAMQSVTIPSEGGCSPQWGPSDNYLYYQDANALWAIPTTIGDTVVFGKKEFIADLGAGGFRLYDIDQAGRIVIARQFDSDPKPPVLFANWRSQLD
jgi:hypothetical protein